MVSISIRRRAFRLLKSESGSATVEAVLWFPLFMLAFFLTFDTAMMFVAETEAVRVVQDGNRLASIGRLSTASDTETYIENTLQSRIPNATATTTIDGSGVIRTVLQFPASDVGKIGGFTAFTGLTLTVSAEHLKEDY